ncbi:MAG: ABC transporter ATP-binding protein [Ruminococcaceae bacterium]|nr:ABC transporter ATP-binding protein [Oscillospiraceae bacterium]
MPQVHEKRSKLLRRLLIYIMEHKYWMLLAIVTTIFSNVFALIGPDLSGKAVDCILGKGNVDFGGVTYYCIWMAVFYVSSAALSYVLSRILIRVSRRVVFKMRAQVFNKLSVLPVSYYDTNTTGDILSRISYDIDTINASLTNDVVHVFSSAVTVIGALFMMLRISPVMVLVFVFTIPVSVCLTKFITSFTKPLFRRRSAKLGELNGFVEEMIGGQKTIKAYNRENQISDKFDEKNEEAVMAYYKADYYGSTVGPTVNFMNNLSLSLVSFFGSLLYFAGSISVGNISTFVLYSRKFSGPINEIANLAGELQSAFSAAERVFRLLDEAPEPEDKPEAVSLSKVEGEVELKNVKFGYNKDVTIINNLSFKAPKGALVAIVGPTGAGKTTIINLLMRFYDIDSGSITLDGTEISDIKRRDMRLAYSMVLQDTWLFSGSVYDNIAYGKEGATKEEVINACKSAEIHDFIMTLPDGYDTVLTDDGSSISKGQKQLLTIARAMMLEAELLILDEATSNVDTRTEMKIQKAMRRLMEDKTCFVIAHRLSTIREADKILVVRDGDIVEQGTHEELMKAESFYAHLYNSQFS